MDRQLKVLLVEDVATDAELAVRELRRAGIACATRRVQTEADLRLALDEFAPDVILSDFSFPGFDGMSVLSLAQEKCPETPFIFVSGTIGEERATEALKCGATDYVLKTNLSRLAPALLRAVHETSERAAHRKTEQELKESEARFSLFMRYLPGIAFVKDLEGRYRFVNPTMGVVAQRKTEELVGRSDEELWPSDLAMQFRDHDRAVIEKKEIVEAIMTIPQDDGSHSWLVHEFPLLSPRGRLMLLGGVAFDITDRVHAEQKIARLSRIFAVLSGINSAIVRIRDRQALFQEVCRIAVEHGKFRMAWIGLAEPGAMKVTPVARMGSDEGYLDEVGSFLRDHADDPGAAGRALREKKPVVANEIETDPQIVFSKEGLARGFRSLAVLPLLVAGDAVGVLALYSQEPGFFDQEEMKLLTELTGDISFALEYLQKKEQLNYLAYYDALTGLPNRSLFSDRLNQLVNAATHDKGMMAVLLLDLERFRNINDTLGRHVGDTLLKLVAARLKNALPGANSVARISADTFAAVLADMREEAGVAHILEGKILACVSQRFTVNDVVLRISAKAGVALFPSDGADADTLFANAETALKKAKASGRRYLFYTPAMNARIAERLTLENKLRRALEEEQFVLYYQPKIDLHSGRISGLEALIRWNDPDRGLVPPLAFIPILEETGMILDVGTWALGKAVSDYRRWLAQGLPTPQVAVNVSPIQLREADFVSGVERAVALDGQGEPGLDLEITESLIMENIEQNIEKLQVIRGMRVGVAIDDFGTGYSSLSYIANLPVNALKIDRSFIVNMARSPDDTTIVSTIISLAHTLNLKVVAEGVETEEQSNLLKLLRCDQAQGYLFSKPLPPEGIETMIAERQGL